MTEAFRILTVCTGNICRSAQAEQLIRVRVARNFQSLESVIEVESAGTGAPVGSAMPVAAAALSRHHGGAPAEHSARQLTVDHIRRADLVLGMAGEHRSAVVRLFPRASRNTFMLTEFAALLEYTEQNPPSPPGDFVAKDLPDRLRSAVKWLSARRGYLPLMDSAPADIVDPYRRGDEIYTESARQIVEALDRAERAAVNLARRVSA